MPNLHPARPIPTAMSHSESRTHSHRRRFGPGKSPREVSADVTEYLDPNTAASVLSEMEPEQAAAVIARMEPPEASMVLAAMEPDDRVDILEHISGPLHDQLLSEMTTAEAAQTRQLEQYPATPPAES